MARRPAPPQTVIPAAMQYIGGVVRSKTGAEPVMERTGPRTATMTITKKDLTVTFMYGYSRSAWRIDDVKVIEGGKEKDVKGDMAEVMRLLNKHTPGSGSGPAINHIAGATRDQGVEVRKTVVIRT